MKDVNICCTLPNSSSKRKGHDVLNAPGTKSKKLGWLKQVEENIQNK
jgi:hypothetical protein